MNTASAITGLGLILGGTTGTPTQGQPPEKPAAITVSHGEARSAQKGSSDYFTGSVRVEQLFAPQPPSTTSGGQVSFEPCARTAWHTHPAGQTLVVTSGSGLIQAWGEPALELRPGDVVWIPAGVKHWHGASPSSPLSHTAIQEFREGKAVVWLEQVPDAQYHEAAKGVHPAGTAGGSPALDHYTREILQGEVWTRPGLSQRDRSLVTLAALMARNQGQALPEQVALALDHGVKPGELSELVAHLAFYTGWGGGEGGAGALRQVFAQRHIGPDQLPPAEVALLPLNEGAEATRASRVEASFGAIAPGVVHYTTEALFRSLWLRPGLAPRDRSLVTVSALIASGQVAQIPYHLNRAMDNGLTPGEVSESLTQLAFYAGWPSVFTALPVVKEVIEHRPAH
nr:carboxymuconolactone decarboxylase family protein [uncultured Holophaga sp.]